MKPTTNPLTISKLKAFLLSSTPDVCARLQAYSTYHNQGIYMRNDSGVVEIAQTVKKKIQGENLELNFASRLITAFEDSQTKVHLTQHTILLDDIKNGKKNWFSSYK